MLRFAIFWFGQGNRNLYHLEWPLVSYSLLILLSSMIDMYSMDLDKVYAKLRPHLILFFKLFVTDFVANV